MSSTCGRANTKTEPLRASMTGALSHSILKQWDFWENWPIQWNRFRLWTVSWLSLWEIRQRNKKPLPLLFLRRLLTQSSPVEAEYPKAKCVSMSSLKRAFPQKRTPTSWKTNTVGAALIRSSSVQALTNSTTEKVSQFQKVSEATSRTLLFLGLRWKSVSETLSVWTDT